MNGAAFCLSATQSGSGKTTLAAGLLRAFARRGLTAQGFKCGPDYVDPTFHAQASGRPARNLDTWMMGREGAQRVFARHMQAAAASGPTGMVAVIEGVMGLLDGRPVPAGEPDGSTLDLAAALRVPLVLTASAKGMGTSLAPLVFGFTHYAAARGVRVLGVIANNVGSERHTALLRDCLAAAHLPPLLGALPRNPDWVLPERQLGLVPAGELGGNLPDALDNLLDALADAVEAHVDMDKLLRLSAFEPAPSLAVEPETTTTRKRLAVARDEAFCFFYEDNDEALRRHGWELIPFSPLRDATVPEADALYLCGGYPEVFANQLAANTSMLEAVRAHAIAGREIWAECGGYMYLCRELCTEQGTFALCGVLNATAHMGGRLRSLGYRKVEVPLPFGLSTAPVTARGHEFHWSRIDLHEPYAPLYPNLPEAGCVARNVRAGYVHLYWGHADIPAAQTGGFERPPVILLNGPSSAGKTSLARAMQARLALEGRASLVLSVDALLVGSAAPNLREAEPVLAPAFHAAVAEAARGDGLIIVDHVIGDNPHWLDDLRTRLGPMPLVGVQVWCAGDELVRRETTRTDRPADTIHSLRQQADIFVPLPGEIRVDTTSTSPDVCAENVLLQLHLLAAR